MGFYRCGCCILFSIGQSNIDTPSFVLRFADAFCAPKHLSKSYDRLNQMDFYSSQSGIL